MAFGRSPQSLGKRSSHSARPDPRSCSGRCCRWPSTIVLGINQTIMAALAMVTIAALIAAPGLGQVVIQALSNQDVGTAFNAGLAIVLLAIILDPSTSAASERVETQRRKS